MLKNNKNVNQSSILFIEFQDFTVQILKINSKFGYDQLFQLQIPSLLILFSKNNYFVEINNLIMTTWILILFDLI